MRYLVDRGYPKESSVRFVSDHYRLPDEARFVISRVVVASDAAESRRRKAVSLESLRDRELFIDGYNVIITIESLLGGRPVYRCDDGFLRDAEGIFRSYRTSDLTVSALSEVLDLVALGGPAKSVVLLDKQISLSGELASLIRRMMDALSLPGTAEAVRDVDGRLKAAQGVVATGDGNIIDSAMEVTDLPCQVARRHHIRPVTI